MHACMHASSIRAQHPRAEDGAGLPFRISQNETNWFYAKNENWDNMKYILMCLRRVLFGGACFVNPMFWNGTRTCSDTPPTLFFGGDAIIGKLVRSGVYVNNHAWIFVALRRDVSLWQTAPLFVSTSLLTVRRRKHSVHHTVCDSDSQSNKGIHS